MERISMNNENFSIALERVNQLRGKMTDLEFQKETTIPIDTQKSWRRKDGGLKNIGMDNAIKIAKSFNTTLDWLFGLTDEKEADTKDNNLEQMDHEIKVPKDFDSEGFISTENYLKLLYIIVHKLGFRISTTQDETVTLTSSNKHLYRFFQDTKNIHRVSDLLPIINQHYNNNNFIVYRNKLMMKYETEKYDKRMEKIYDGLDYEGDENSGCYTDYGKPISEAQYNGMIMQREDELNSIDGPLRL
jgi:hypothetical protein